MAGPLFPLGQVVATPGVLSVMTPEEPVTFLARHQSGDWGRVSEDAKENEYGLKYGFRIVSSYVTTHGATVWVITEHDRGQTSLLLPEEY